MIPVFEGIFERHRVEPGGRYATDRHEVIETLLGSCVAACLYDPVRGVAGLNHFLLAAPHYARHMPLTHTEAGQYGINAMELLINDLLRMGAEKPRLKAKVFGGASVLDMGSDNFFCVHEVNQRFIREYLATEGIPIVSEDLGGVKGRVIYFHTGDFTVKRRFIQHVKLEEIAVEEHNFWKVRAEKPEIQEGAVTLFK